MGNARKNSFFLKKPTIYKNFTRAPQVRKQSSDMRTILFVFFEKTQIYKNFTRAPQVRKQSSDMRTILFVFLKKPQFIKISPVPRRCEGKALVHV